jgi:molybdate/tungstate transport system permease protein
VHSFLESIEATVIIASAAAALAVVLGLPTAYLLARHDFKLKSLVEAIVDMPIVVPHVIVGIMVILAFAAYGLGPWLRELGVQVINTLPGAVVAVSYLSSTYAVRTMEAAIRLLDPDVEAVARTLGAGPLRAFSSTVLPNIWRSVINGALLAWARSVSEAGALFVVAYYVALGNRLVYPASVYIYTAYESVGLPTATEYSAALLVLILVVFIAVRAAVGRVRG